MTDRTCPLGDDCDLTVAWMAGRAEANATIAALTAAERDALRAERDALRAHLADGSFYQEKDIDALMNERDALRAHLATARADTFREAANLCGDMARTLNGLPTGSPHSQDSADVIAVGLIVAQKAILSLIDTPTPSAPSPEAVAQIQEK